MSVQTEIDRISGEVTDQAALLAQIQTALEGKTAGGGSGGVAIETCTVTITYTVARSSLYMWSLVGYDDETGKNMLLHNESYTNGVSQSITYDNVVCGTDIALYCEGMMLPNSYECGGGVELVAAGSILGFSGRNVILKAPSTAGSVGSCILS